MKFSARYLGQIEMHVDFDEDAFCGLGRIYREKEADSLEDAIGELAKGIGLRENASAQLRIQLTYDTFLLVDQVCVKPHGRKEREWTQIYKNKNITLLPTSKYNQM